MFNRSPPPPEHPSGREVIRQALSARNRKHNLANTARDLGIVSSALEAFVNDGADLPSAAALIKLAERVWAGHLAYDPAADRVRPANVKPATTVHVSPPQVWPSNTPRGPVPPRREPLDPGPRAARPKWMDWIR